MIRFTLLLDFQIVENSKQKMFWILAVFVVSCEKMGLCLLILAHYIESVEVLELLSVVYHCQTLQNLFKPMYSSGYKLVAEYVQGISSRTVHLQSNCVGFCRFISLSDIFLITKQLGSHIAWWYVNVLSLRFQLLRLM
jgi:hypothetical protein